MNRAATSTSVSPPLPRLLRGAPIAADLRFRIAADVADFCTTHGYAPALAVVMVGTDGPSAVYLHKILDGCRKVGVVDRLIALGGSAGPEKLRDAICTLNCDPQVAGVIVQMPLPPTIPMRKGIDSID